MKSQNFSYFSHFFFFFTGIFLVMTVIILQVLRYGVYTSVDNSLSAVAQDADSFIQITLGQGPEMTSPLTSYQTGTSSSSSTSGSSSSLSTTSSGQTSSSSETTASSRKVLAEHVNPASSLTANTDIIIYDNKGNILNNINFYSNLNYISPDFSELNTIQSQKIRGKFGSETETYRMITVKLDSDVYPTAAYMTVVVNTTQLDATNSRYTRLIVSIMILFWLISVVASIYLAKWTTRPLMLAYEKQKTFVENASHELRTPLAVLQNRLETLFRRPNSTIMDNFEDIASSLEEVRNMRILTSNLLDLARRDDGLKVHLEEISPEFFDRIFSNYSLIANENGKQLTTFNDMQQPIQSDKALLKQLMTILFDNAVKYTGSDGHISISVTRSRDRKVLITVADNGLGISDEDKKRVFDRFYRVDKARTRQTGGFGLGLSLAQQIVQSLKGTITISDNQPAGTIFQVKLADKN
ncbi:Two component system sensor histidine kinase CiaH [Streptococcus sp. DD12]|nr:Two component system sensor histidine kinase CiaH [Streptococcus sp. DD12]